MGRRIALGQSSRSTAIVTSPESLEEKVDILTKQIDTLTMAFSEIRCEIIKRKKPKCVGNVNKDGIPIGQPLIGTSTKGGVQVMYVASDGYYIGTIKYDSLSAAAEATSGVRRSGWTYWKLPDG